MDGRIEQLRQQLRENPASRHFYQLGELLRKEEQHQEAVEVLKQGLQHHPRYVAAWVSLGRAMVLLGAMQEAEQAYVSALELDPENAVAARLLGQASALRGDWLQAIKKLKLARALSPLDEGLNQEIAEVEAELAGRDTALPSSPEPPSPELPAPEQPAQPVAGPPPVSEPGHGEADPLAAPIASGQPPDVAPGEDEEPWENAQTVQLPDPPPEREAGENAEMPPAAALDDAAADADADDEVSHITAPIPVAELREAAGAQQQDDQEQEDDAGRETQPGIMLQLPTEPASEPPAEAVEAHAHPAVIEEPPLAPDPPECGSQGDTEQPVPSSTEPPAVEIPMATAATPEPIVPTKMPGPMPHAPTQQPEIQRDHEILLRKQGADPEEDEDEDLPLPTLTLARLAAEQGDTRLAERTLRTLLAQNPANRQAAELLGQLQVSEEQEVRVIPDTGEEDAAAPGDLNRAKIVTLQRWLDTVKLAAEQRAR